MDSVQAVLQGDLPLKGKIRKLNLLYNQIIDDNDSAMVDEAKQFLDSILNQPSIVTDSLNAVLQTSIARIGPGQLKAIFGYLLPKLNMPNASLTKSSILVAQRLAALYKSDEDYHKAIQVLESAPLEKLHNNDAENVNFLKAEIFIQISELYLKLADYGNAEAYLSNASALLPLFVVNSGDKSVIGLKIKLEDAYSEAFFVNGKFYDAATRKLTIISNIPKEFLDDDWCTKSYQLLISYLLVSTPDFRKAKLVDSLYETDPIGKNSTLSSIQQIILDKMYHKSFVSLSEIREFVQTIENTSEPLSIKFYQNILQHNLVAISKLYSNIRFETLVHILEIESFPIKVEIEDLIVSMVAENLLTGVIDQVDEIVYFNLSNSGNHEDIEYLKWQGNISDFCNEMDQVANSIETSQ